MINNLLLSQKIKPIGRTFLKDDMLFANFSGSGIKCNVSGNTLKVTLFATRFNDDNNRPFVSILVDDKRYDFGLDLEYKTIELPLTDGVHEVQILKRTEASVSHMAIKEISVDNFYELTEENRLNIEFYGDSLTCGFGVLSTDPSEPFRTITESFLDGYSYLIAKGLNANYSAISVSGFPVYKSRWNQGFNVDSIADLISYSSYQDDMTFEIGVRWDNANYKADLVIINLGTNDESYFTPGQDWVDALISKTGSYEAACKEKEFIDKLESLYKRIVKFFEELYEVYGPNLKVLYLLGMVDVSSFIYEAINKAVNEFNNPNVKHYKLTGPTKDSIFGAVWHPGSKMHENTAAEVLKVIKEFI